MSALVREGVGDVEPEALSETFFGTNAVEFPLQVVHRESGLYWHEDAAAALATIAIPQGAHAGTVVSASSGLLLIQTTDTTAVGEAVRIFMPVPDSLIVFDGRVKMRSGRDRLLVEVPQQVLRCNMRVHFRVPYVSKVVLEFGGRSHLLEATNISGGGIGLRIPARLTLPQDTEYTIELGLPKLPGRLAARIMWRQEDMAGFKFLDLPTAARAHLEDLTMEIYRQNGTPAQ